MVNLLDLRTDKIRKQIGMIEVYNIQAQDKEKILEELQKYSDIPNENLVGLFIIRDMFPYLTNIEIDEDLDEQKIIDVLLNANGDLKQAMQVMDEIIGEFIVETTETIKQYKDKHEALDKLQNKWNKEIKEQKKKELEKQLKELS